MVDKRDVIADALAGKRISVTGATGFLGTALVERLLRAVPDCEVVLLVRPGKRSTGGPAGASARSCSNDAFDRLRAELGKDGVRRDGRPARHGRSPATSAPTGSASTTPAGPCWPAATSSSTRPPRSSFDSPLDGAVEVNLLGPTRIAATLHDLGVTPAPRRRVDLLRRRQPPGRRPRGAGRREPVRRRRRLARRGRRRPPGPQPTPRPTSRTPEQLAEFRKAARAELGAAGTPALAAKTEQLRERWVSRPHGRGRPGPRRSPRLARRLRLHQGARRAGPGRDPRRRARHHRAAVDHRVGAGRAPARAGSAASAWPSRSSSPTPAAC